MLGKKPVIKINPTNIILALTLIIFVFGSGYKLGEYVQLKNLNASLSQQAKNLDFSLFWEAWNKLENKYIDKSKLDTKKMYYGAIKGMVAAVEDPYTFFLSPEENKQSKDDLGGKFDGIGAQLGLKDNQVVIISPLRNSPAEKVGLKAGDIIVKVDDKEIKGLSLTQVVSQIRGKRGTAVKLKILRNSQALNFTIIRDQIIVPPVELSLEKPLNCQKDCYQVAYLKLNQFGDNTNNQWDQAVATIKKQWEAEQIKGLVLDLRSNPGGYLESSVYLAGEFLPMGKVVVKQQSTVLENKDYVVSRKGQLQDIPLAVLIDQGSASAAEILAGALKDYKRASLIGEKTFGKGSVQEPLDLKDGAGLHITVAKWILPNGNWINGKGIEADIKVKNVIKDGNTLTRETDLQLEKAIETLGTKTN
jgi:carboxyl-terminal processing protease